MAVCAIFCVMPIILYTNVDTQSDKLAMVIINKLNHKQNFSQSRVCDKVQNRKIPQFSYNSVG